MENYILSVYSVNASKEFVLPVLHNQEYTLTIDHQTFHLTDNLTLHIDALDNEWHFLESPDYVIHSADQWQNGKLPLHDANYMIRTKNGEQLSMIVSTKPCAFQSYRKFVVRKGNNVSIGGSPDNVLQYTYAYNNAQYISHQMAIIRYLQGGAELEDLGRNGIFLNDARVKGKASLHFGDHILIWGLDIIYLGNILAIRSDDNLKIRYNALAEIEGAQLATAPSGENHPFAREVYHRAPRNMEKLHTETVEIEAPPQPQAIREMPLIMVIGPALTMAIPMALSSGMAVIGSRMASSGSSNLFMYTGIVTALASALVGAGWAIANLRMNKTQMKEQENHRFDAYSEYLVKSAENVKQMYEYNTEVMLHTYPEPKQLIAPAAEAQKLLWNRNKTHADVMSYRVGTGDQPFQVKIDIPKERFTLVDDSLSDKPKIIRDSYKLLRDVPITVDLFGNKVVGLVGGDEKAGAYQLLYDLVAGIAAENSYTDVKLCFAYDEEQGTVLDRWGFAHWLPHTWSQDKKIRYVASSRDEASDLFYEISKILRRRDEEKESSMSNKEILYKPYFILFVESPEVLEGELITKYITDPDTSLGITLVLMAENYEDLPNTCEEIIENDATFQGVYNVRTGERTQVHFDHVSELQLESFARRISNLEITETEVGGEIPDAITFFDMYGVKKLSDFQVADRWKKNRTYQTMKAMVGQMAGGTPCYLDVHEKYHGPHGLVAGTTGSGKSETLQTYMLSLALNFSPDDIGFFIIDYKGGGMANLFTGLPHVLGAISNLSGNQVHRAMVSIKSENRRRQRIFNENGVNNINAYTQLYKNGEADEPVPHLFIIIDEFAELKREEGDFMRELISVAQVGRSLGVHLILATQKPSGTVDDNIWSNSKFRLCLRVQDRQDSMDMLHKPDAAFLTQAGRCYLQVGNDELYELFQSGWSGAAYHGDTSNEKKTIAVMLADSGKPAVTLHKKKSTAASGKEKTQLDAVVEYLQEVAKEEGYREPKRLWLPVLPESMTFMELPGYDKEFFDGSSWPEYPETWSLSTMVGLMDDPENQNQAPCGIDFMEGGNTAVVGIAQSGKSTLIQSILYSLSHRYSPKYFNFYALDFSSNMLSAFEKDPHCGGVLYESDLSTIGKFFRMIDKMIDTRKKKFRGGNYQQFVKKQGVTEPAVIIAIDNMANFREKTENKYDDTLIRFTRECMSYGIYFLISGAGFNSAEIPIRMHDNFHTVICLEMADRYAYMDAMNCQGLHMTPETGVHGRGLIMVSDRPLEFQAALSLEAQDDYQRQDLIKEDAETMRDAWTGELAMEIPKIPEHPTYDDFVRRKAVQELLRTPQYLPFAFDQATADIYSVNLSETYTYLVQGNPRTGKTNVLRLLMLMAKERNGQIVVIENGSVKLKRTADEQNIRYISDYEGFSEFMRDDFIPMFVERNKKKRALLEQGLEEDELFSKMHEAREYYVFIEDLSAFCSMLYSPESVKDNMQGGLENLLEKGFMHNIYIFAGLEPDKRTDLIGRGIYESFAKAKTGIHLGGNVMNQRIFDFGNMPIKEQGVITPAGIGAIPPIGTDSYHFVVIPEVKTKKK